jgi:hypothetical protein
VARLDQVNGTARSFAASAASLHSWGSSPHVLPALQDMSVEMAVQGGLPPEWARGFRRLRSIAAAHLESNMPALHETVGSDSVAGQSAASSASLPPEWARGFPQLQTLVMLGFGWRGSLPEAWLEASSFQTLIEM